MKFTSKENKQLQMVYRALFYFKKKETDKLLILSRNSDVKSLISNGLLTSDANNIGWNWFRLTEKGIELFQSFRGKRILNGGRHYGFMSEELNESIFEGKNIINFNELLNKY